MTNKQNFIFGRHDSERHDEYFGLVNTYYLDLVRRENEFVANLAGLNDGSQESQDFGEDLLNLFDDLRTQRAKIGQKIAAHRKAMGW